MLKLYIYAKDGVALLKAYPTADSFASNVAVPLLARVFEFEDATEYAKVAEFRDRVLETFDGQNYIINNSKPPATLTPTAQQYEGTKKAARMSIAHAYVGFCSTWQPVRTYCT
jgi:hypothetical protein